MLGSDKRRKIYEMRDKMPIYESGAGDIMR